jgi:hypothetical protein
MGMSEREWKQGDVAMVNDTTRPDAPWRVAMCTASARPGVCETRWRIDTGEVWGSVSQVRPLAVIDPARLTWDGRTPSAQEFTEWAESLPAGEFATGILTIADALRDLPPVIVPRPEEPTGLGAVVEDAQGARWVRHQTTGGGGWYVDGIARPYADIAAVRVLSEGVQP